MQVNYFNIIEVIMSVINIVPNRSYGGIQQVASSINESLKEEGIAAKTFFYTEDNKIYENKSKMLKWFHIIKDSRRFLSREDSDVLIVHNPLAILFVPFHLFKRTIYVMHGPIAPIEPFMSFNYIQRWVSSLLFFVLSKKIVCVSAGLKTNIPFFLRFKSKTIHNCPSSTFYYDNSDKYKFDYLEESDVIKVVHFGRLSYQKNQEFSLRVIHYMKSIGCKVQLYIIGSGENSDFLVSEAKKLNLNYTNFSSNLSTEYDVIFCKPLRGLSWIKECFDVAIFPSRYEGLNISIMECLTVDMPVISSNCNFGPKEIFELASQNLKDGTINKYFALLPKDVENDEMLKLWSASIIDISKCSNKDSLNFDKEMLDLKFKESWNSVVSSFL